MQFELDKKLGLLSFDHTKQDTKIISKYPVSVSMEY